MICEQYLSCLIFITFMKCCFCISHAHADSVTFEEKKSFSVDSAEIIRRRNVAKNYLKEIQISQEDWIETYHESFSSVFTPTNFEQDNLLKNEKEISDIKSTKNVDLPSQKNSGDSDSKLESSSSNVNFNENPTGTGKSKFENLKKSDSMTHEEFIRRRDILISYHDSLPDLKTTEYNPETVLSNDTVHQSVDKFTENDTKLSKDITDQTLHDSLKSDINPIPKSRGSKEILESSKAEFKTSTSLKSNKQHPPINFKMPVKDIDGSQKKIKSKGICSKKLTGKEKSENCKEFFNPNDMKSTKVFINCNVENGFKNISVDTDKIVEVVIKDTKFNLKKYFINGETLTLTELNKLQENLARLSFLQNSANNVYSITRMELINSINKETSLLKQDEPIQETLKQSLKVSETDNIIASNAFNDEDSNIKKFTTDIDKRVGFEDSKVKIPLKNSFLSNSINHEKDKVTSSHSNTNKLSYDPEILRRKKIMNSFMKSLNSNQKNWIETYDFDVSNSESGRNFFYSPPIPDSFKKDKISSNFQTTTERTKKLSALFSQEKLYVTRWINKLQNKFKDFHNGYGSLSILVSTDMHQILGELSQEFDIVIFDELITSIISNATFNNNKNIINFDFENTFYNIASSLNSTSIYIPIVVILFAFVLLYILQSKNKLKWILKLIILSSFVWHANKMYQQKIAEKHTVMSRVAPSYCESILNQESGIIAHFKEYFRSWYHDDECEKYYEAVMVSPSAEINPFSISVDLIFDGIFQMFQPLGRNINSFYKILAHDLSYVQQFIVIIITFGFFVFIFYTPVYLYFSSLAFRNNYKITFPFSMGSTEPTAFSIGSRVEEIDEKENSLKLTNTIHKPSLVHCENKDNIEGVILQDKNKTETKNYIEDVILQEYLSKFASKHSNLILSKYSIYKTHRILTRSNSF